MIIHIICTYLLFYDLTTYLLYLNYFIFCNRKYRIKNEKNRSKHVLIKQELIKNAFF